LTLETLNAVEDKVGCIANYNYKLKDVLDYKVIKWFCSSHLDDIIASLDNVARGYSKHLQKFSRRS